MCKINGRGLLTLVVILSGLGIGIARYGISQPVPVVTSETPLDQLSETFRSISQRTLPAVVTLISTSKPMTVKHEPQQLQSPFDDEFFRQFFGDQFKDLPRFPQNQTLPPRQGRGSGFIIDASGIILTNSHVVNGADRVVVRFHDGSEVEADSWHTDPWSDVAIVRVTPKQPLVTVPLGNSDTTEIGDWVLALGDPFGVGMSVTAGIISGKGRAPAINDREDYLQTDAAINPGNSGGPLVNMRGEVIGINTAISTRSGGYDGVGFAIPINLARWVSSQLIQNGKVSRPYLGVSVRQMDDEVRRYFGLKNGEGVEISDVFHGGPAQKGGLVAGDVILKVDGKRIKNGIELQGIVERLKIGQKYPVEILRDGKRQTIEVTLDAMPKQFGQRTIAQSPGSADPHQQETASSKKLGLEVTDLTPETRRQLGLDSSIQGVLVKTIDPQGPAFEAGVRQGHVIQRVGTTPVKSVAEFEEAIQKASGKEGILLFIRSRSGSRFLVVHPKE